MFSWSKDHEFEQVSAVRGCELFDPVPFTRGYNGATITIGASPVLVQHHLRGTDEHNESRLYDWRSTLRGITSGEPDFE